MKRSDLKEIRNLMQDMFFDLPIAKWDKYRDTVDRLIEFMDIEFRNMQLDDRKKYEESDEIEF